MTIGKNIHKAAASALLATTAIAGAIVAPAPAHAQAAQSYDIPAGPLAVTLNRFAEAADIKLFYDSSLTNGLSSAGLKGSFGTAEALSRLLTGTGLTFRQNGRGSFTLERAPQSADGAIQLGPVRVEGDGSGTPVDGYAGGEETATSPVVGYAARRSASGTKTDTPILEVPQSVSVIGREEMSARGVQDFTDVIRYTPGVTVNMWGTDNRGFEWLMLRGFSSYSNISYRDGLLQSDFGDTFPLTEPYGVERVEVLRGPSSVTYGAGDAGGIINRVSKRPTGDRIREIELQYGSFDRKRVAFDFSDSVGGAGVVNYRLVGLALDSDSEEEYPSGDEVSNQRLYIAPSLQWRPSDTTSLTLLGQYLKNEADDNVGYLTAADGSLSSVKVGDPGYSRINQDQFTLGYQFAHRFSDAWELRQNFNYIHTTADKHILRRGALSADRRSYARTALGIFNEVDQIGVDTMVEGRIGTGPIEHTLLLGIDYNNLTGDERSYSGAAPSIDLLDPAYHVAIAEPTGPRTDFKQKTRRLGLYAQDQIRIADRWLVTLSGRHDRVKMITDNRLARATTSQTDNVFSGRAGITYLVGNGLAPYVSYSESFLPNSGVDAEGDSFRPSRGRGFEAGVKYQPEGSNTLVAIALFDVRKTNVVTYDNSTFEARQIGEQRSRGLEIEAKTELMPGLNATTSYTYLDMDVLKSADTTEIGKTPIQVANHQASFWIDYSSATGFGVGGGARYIGRRWNDVANTSSEPGVALIDASIHYDTGPWRLAVNASNLFDKDYYASRAYGNYYIGSARNVTATISGRF